MNGFMGFLVTAIVIMGLAIIGVMIAKKTPLREYL